MVADEILVSVEPARNGLGLFARRRFRQGDTIIKVRGQIVDYRVLWKRGGQFASNCLRFGPSTYLDPGGNLANYLNHSCVPSAGLRKTKNQLFLFAARPIPAGAEIVIDYSTTIGDDDIWTMRCNCGASTCRGTIRRFGSLPMRLQRAYLTTGLVPRYIVRTLIAPW
jgi:SET domain-containing protein